MAPHVNRVNQINWGTARSQWSGLNVELPWKKGYSFTIWRALLSVKEQQCRCSLLLMRREGYSEVTLFIIGSHKTCQME